ncbi:MAG: FGGY family carbohydrate kinase, partial [Eubacteriales bacterium]
MTDINLAKTYLGIEFGSTRIKGVLIDETFTPVASGAHDWENRMENGFWTYSTDDILHGMQDCFASLAADVREKFGRPLTTVAAIGISGMMHGYLAFDGNDRLLVPFRTWRNTTTADAAEELSALFRFNIPQRWSIAHLYQAILNGEPHVKNVAHITTLAGYIHFLLTGQREVGVGEASGIFPIDSAAGTYDAGMLAKLAPRLRDHGFEGDLLTIL